MYIQDQCNGPPLVKVEAKYDMQHMKRSKVLGPDYVTLEEIKKTVCELG